LCQRSGENLEIGFRLVEVDAGRPGIRGQLGIKKYQAEWSIRFNAVQVRVFQNDAELRSQVEDGSIGNPKPLGQTGEIGYCPVDRGDKDVTECLRWERLCLSGAAGPGADKHTGDGKE